MDKLELLTKVEQDFYDGKLYRLSEITAIFEVINIDDNHWLFTDTSKGHWIDFALMAFVSKDDDDTYVSTVFKGSGTVDQREMRHVWFGDGDGYVFYLPGDAVIKALEFLKTYFDMT